MKQIDRIKNEEIRKLLALGENNSQGLTPGYFEKLASHILKLEDRDEKVQVTR